jgi:hypothetical protein
MQKSGIKSAQLSPKSGFQTRFLGGKPLRYINFSPFAHFIPGKGLSSTPC